MSIENEKDNIIAILKENGYDTNSPDTISLLSSIINNRIINYIHSDKDAIIRILSSKEYEEYIANGSCDGSIITGDNNVWHDFNNIQIKGMMKNTYYAIAEAYNPIYPEENYSYSNHYPSVTREENWYYSISQDNLTNNYICSCKSGMKIQCIGNEGSSQIVEVPKNVQLQKDILNIDYTCQARSYMYRNGTNYCTYIMHCHIGFRPVLQYKDNNKSKNLYY